MNVAATLTGDRRRAGPVSAEEAVNLARQIGEGLGAARAKDTVHRDRRHI